MLLKYIKLKLELQLHFCINTKMIFFLSFALQTKYTYSIYESIFTFTLTCFGVTVT